MRRAHAGRELPLAVPRPRTLTALTAPPQFDLLWEAAVRGARPRHPAGGARAIRRVDPLPPSRRVPPPRADANTLESYGVKPGGTLHMVLALRGGF